MEFLRQLERILLSSEAKDAVIYAKDYMISVDDSFATVIFKDKSIIVPRDLTNQKITEIDLRHIGSILPTTCSVASVSPVVTEPMSPKATTTIVSPVEEPPRSAESPVSEKKSIERVGRDRKNNTRID